MKMEIMIDPLGATQYPDIRNFLEKVQQRKG